MSRALPVAARAVSPALVVTLAWFAAFNFRAGFIGLGPVLPNLTRDLALSHAEASVLVAIPTLMMGLAAVPGGRMADRVGAERVIALALALVAVAGGLRAAAPGLTALVLLTVAFGAGIGIGQPALPRLMRSVAPERLELATGLYASGLVSGSIISASVTGPLLLDRLGPETWRGPLAIWGAVAVATLLVWLALLSRDGAVPAHAPRLDPAQADWSPWRSRQAWLVAAIFAAQGVAYYLLIAWLPSVYAEEGLGVHETAALFAMFNAATLPAILGFPVLSQRLGSRKVACLIASLLFLVGAVGLMRAPLAEPWRWLWPPLCGAGVAAVFALGLVMPADVSPPGRTGAAAGMVLGLGYAGSALGPLLAGIVRDATGSFAAAIAVLPAVGVAMVLLSLLAPAPGATLPAPAAAQEVGAP